MPRLSPIPNDSPAALVLGLDSHGLAIARALADGGVTVYAVEQNRGLPGAVSNRIRRIFVVDDFMSDQLVASLLQVRTELGAHPRVALLAVNDRQVSVIARHASQLQPYYCIAWLEQAQTILKLQRKDELESVCRQHGMAYPRSVVFASTALPAEAAALRYPVIVKPVRPLSSFKTLLAVNAGELQQHLQRYARDLPILGQEYIAGADQSIYFGALMLDRGRVLHGMAGRKISSFPPARGQTTIAETVDAPAVMRLTEQFFAGLGLSGPVSLELKRDPEGHYWVIEPTVGRTDFWAELCIGAGFNQPLMEFQLAIGVPVTPAASPRRCVWYDTERDPLAWLRLCWRERTLHPRRSYQCFPYHGHGDWRPVARAFKRLGLARLAQWLRPRAEAGTSPR